MTQPSGPPPQIVRFSVFELDLRSGELRKAGVRIALQEQSLRVLISLLERAGDVVTREELRQQLWPADTFVDFDHGLNTAVKRLRDALGDTADTPRFIETLPKRGYRFMGPVERGAFNKNAPRRDGDRFRPRRLPVALLAALVLGAASVAGVILWRTSSDESASSAMHLETSIAPADRLLAAHELDRNRGLGFWRPSRTAIALSPNGQTLVYSAGQSERQQLYARSFNSPEAAPISGTDGADSPFWSPDGAWIGYWADNKIKRVPAAGGPSVTVCEIGSPLFGASWGVDGRIVFGLVQGGLKHVSASGGNPTALTTLGPGEYSHRLPHVLPDANAILFTTLSRPTDWKSANIEAYIPATGQRKVLASRGADARYHSTGHLVFAREGTLLAIPFDAARVETTGPALGVLADVMQALGANRAIDTGAAQVSLSRSGSLAYVPGGTYPTLQTRPVWVNRNGQVSPVGLPAGEHLAPRLSPDGRRLALVTTSRRDRNVWVFDLARQAPMRLTFEGQGNFPIWMDDSRLTFAASTKGPANLSVVAADGSRPAESLTTSDRDQLPADWSRDGRTLFLVEVDPKTRLDIWTMSLIDGKPRLTPVVRGSSDEMEPALSPDGRLLAYTSDESEQLEVYLQPFPGPGAKVKVSSGGGYEPVWAHNGRELFFVTMPTDASPRTMMAVGIRTHPTLEVGRPSALFNAGRYVTATPVRGYDVAEDGRFLMIEPASVPNPSPITQVRIVLNWAHELRAKMRGASRTRP